MPLGGIVLVPGASGWQVGTDGFRTLDLPADVSPEVAATQVAAALQAGGYQGEDVILAIPGTWCLAASFEVPTAHRRDTLALQLEEQLPIAAEEFVADFVQHGDRALGIAGRLALLSPIIEALEAKQVHVAHVVPLALLALQSLGPEVRRANACILWQQGAEVDVMRLEGGQLAGWSVVPADARTVAAEVARLSLDGAVGSVWCHLDAPFAQALRAQGSSPTGFDRDQFAAALETVGRIASGSIRPLVDLRRDALAAPDPLRRMRGSLNAALLTAMVLLSVAGIAMLVRGSRYQQVVADSEAQQAVVFQQAFPNAAVPVNVRARLEAEYRALGSSGMQADTGTEPAILMLRNLLGHVPSSTNIDLSRVAISGKRFRLEGSAATADQATAISNAISSSLSSRLEPLSLQTLPNGSCSFVIQSAVPAPATAPRAPEAP